MKAIFTRASRTSTIWGAVAFLTLALIGLINLTHADFYSGKSFHKAQLVWTVVGFVVAIGTAVIDLSVIRRLTPLAYGFGLLLLLIVLFTDPINQSRRWIKLFGFTLQPSEPMKLVTVLMVASHLDRKRTSEPLRTRSLMAPLAIVLAPALLILVEPDLGTAVVTTTVGLTVILFAGVRLRTVIRMVGILLLIVPFAWKFNVIKQYQKDRILLWLAPDTYEWSPKRRALMEKALQPERARWAIGSGQLAGKGPRNGSRIRLRYLPEMQTDFIVATLAEEYGFLGCSFVLLLFFAYLSWGIAVALGAPDRFGVLCAVGATTVVGLQMFINLGMVTGLLPVVGVTLPLFSYGGSSLVSTMVGFGLLLNVARSRGTL